MGSINLSGVWAETWPLARSLALPQTPVTGCLVCKACQSVPRPWNGKCKMIRALSNKSQNLSATLAHRTNAIMNLLHIKDTTRSLAYEDVYKCHSPQMRNDAFFRTASLHCTVLVCFHRVVLYRTEKNDICCYPLACLAASTDQIINRFWLTCIRRRRRLLSSFAAGGLCWVYISLTPN